MGDKAIDIAQLISPLRYDVLVRAQFFEFLATRTRRTSPTTALVVAAGSQPYAVWFREVAMARFRPWVLKDPAALRANFAERVLATRALQHSFAQNGFDPRTPVTLRVTTGSQPRTRERPSSRTVHVGDGGHRLALLLHAGGMLQPGHVPAGPPSLP